MFRLAFAAGPAASTRTLVPMLTLSPAAAVFLAAVVLASGFLAGCAWRQQQLRAGRLALELHRRAMATLRRRYRRRRLLLRDARKAALADCGQALAAAQSRATGLEQALRAARERVAILESDQGLMRIERDELLAHTQRLRALEAPRTDNPPAAPGPTDETRRAGLAERSARIHELECRLRESAIRIGELESSLHTWKYRIAPLALHAKLQRERAAQARHGSRGTPKGSAQLRRIHGIGRVIERRLNAAGIRDVGQLAGLSPAEIANLAGRIGVAPTRPAREHWLEQARALLASGPSAAPQARAR